MYPLFVSSREVLKRLKADGWYKVAQKGSHVQLKHPTKAGRVTVVHPSRDLDEGTLRSMERQSGRATALAVAQINQGATEKREKGQP